MVRVVFDTVVFVRSLINPYSIAGRLIWSHTSRYRLFLSEPILAEILDVLQRPELTRKFKSLHEMDIPAVLELLSRSERVDVPAIPRVSRDPKDDKFLATALAAAVDYLVSEDQDLLVLKQYEGVEIVDVATFLGILESEGQPHP